MCTVRTTYFIHYVNDDVEEKTLRNDECLSWTRVGSCVKNESRKTWF